MITVKELIEKLQKYDPNMPVFCYNGNHEEDNPIEFIHEVGTHMYCKSDSYVEEYLGENPLKKVLLLHNNSWAVKDGKLDNFYSEFEFPFPDSPWKRTDKENNEIHKVKFWDYYPEKAFPYECPYCGYGHIEPLNYCECCESEVKV